MGEEEGGQPHTKKKKQLREEKVFQNCKIIEIVLLSKDAEQGCGVSYLQHTSLHHSLLGPEV